MSKVIVTGVFTAEWDCDEYRADFEEPDLTNEDILEECVQSFKDNPSLYLDGSLHVQGGIS